MSGITLDEIQASFSSIKVSDGTNDLLIDGSGHLSVNDGGNSLTVDATDFDIRDLSASQDNVAISDGTDTLAVNADGSLNALVTATDLDIRDLSATQDNVAISDGTDTLAINADGSINAQTIPDAYDVWQTSTLTATNTAGEIAATPLSSRLNMLVQNLGNADIYIGEDNTVTDSTGVKIPKGGSAEFLFGANANVWAITSSGTADLRIAEFAA